MYLPKYVSSTTQWAEAWLLTKKNRKRKAVKKIMRQVEIKTLDS